MVTEVETRELLRLATSDPASEFIPGQWDAIDALANHRRRVLLVQRTGWGKSMVYFLTTKILRDAGAGPTLIISPLLSLMRNQVEAARGLGLIAETINSTNQEDWAAVIARVVAGQVDLLLVSPERLANPEFVEACLLPIAGRINFFVVDEAHCISDWGHDFRPDYQRIDRILQQLPANVAVLATTATANDRVVRDVANQLGADALLQRGALARDSLQLQTTPLPSRAARLAWLAQVLPTLPGSGIIYTLTTKDADRVAAWLRSQDIDVRPYHAQLEADEEGIDREELERRLLNNQVKALVATSALGMGFDKPDLGFVVHFQTPQSVVHYYQQVGRAGRGIGNAVGVLLGGDEDAEINDYFIGSAFPPEWQIDIILQALNQADDGLSINQLLETVNLREGQVEMVLKILAVSHNAPVLKQGSRWYRTANPFQLDEQRVRRLSAVRVDEARAMQAYLTTDDCLMLTLSKALDDPFAQACGRCENCLGRSVISVVPDRPAIAEASRFIKQSEVVVKPRKRWQGGALPTYGFTGNIAAAAQCEPGRALSIWRDAGWGELVETEKQAGRFSDDLLQACVEMIRDRWRPDPQPTWVTCVPSLRNHQLVPDFAARLAHALNLPFRPAIVKVAETQRQRNMMNSWQQARNLDGAFQVLQEHTERGPVLLIDDVADSRWSLTVIGALLRGHGSGPVFPCVLALASSAGG